jgi:hypothetical protein
VGVTSARVAEIDSSVADDNTASGINNAPSNDTGAVGTPATVDPSADADAFALNMNKTGVIGTPATADPAANADAFAPEIALYSNKYWEDLAMEIRDAFGILGYNETTWNGGIAPETPPLH